MLDEDSLEKIDASVVPALNDVRKSLIGLKELTGVSAIMQILKESNKKLSNSRPLQIERCRHMLRGDIFKFDEIINRINEILASPFMAALARNEELKVESKPDIAPVVTKPKSIFAQAGAAMVSSLPTAAVNRPATPAVRFRSIFTKTGAVSISELTFDVLDVKGSALR